MNFRDPQVEVRLAAALEAGDNLDARVVLLTLHAGIVRLNCFGSLIR